MNKLMIASAKVAVMFVVALAATAFGRGTSAERTQITQSTAATMPAIEELTLSADTLPVQYYHPI